MIIHPSLLGRFARRFCLKLLDRAENNGITDFSKNGEKYFIRQLFQKLRTKSGTRIIFDIGSNIGNYSRYIEREAANTGTDIVLHMFEPLASSFGELKEAFIDTRFILNNLAASNQSGEACMFFDREKSSMASLYRRDLRDYAMTLGNSATIRTMRMDEYIEKNSIPYIDFVKIDVEGHELMALEGFGEYLDSKFIAVIQFEYGETYLDSHTSLRDIFRLFEDKGFLVAKLMPKGLEIRKYQRYMENYAYSNYIALSREYFEK